jgi:signal transduction histidine kinase
MREELAESKKRELELQKKERELVASLSHDLKTPVTGIKVASELLQMRLSKKEEMRDSGEEGNVVIGIDELKTMSQDAKGIYQKAEQIDALVSDLFASSLDDLGEFKVSCSDEESSVLNSIVKSYDGRELAVIGELPEVLINIDRKCMSQVIGNIISNSYKYADTKIDIGYRLSEGFLEMQIRDYGPGVPTDELDLITNKFYRGKKWQDTEKGGNGLGLYISKTLMNKMNGDLLTESDGEGLAITLIIPLS